MTYKMVRANTSKKKTLNPRINKPMFQYMYLNKMYNDQANNTHPPKAFKLPSCFARMLLMTAKMKSKKHEIMGNKLPKGK
jgi:hypothetical protein